MYPITLRSLIEAVPNMNSSVTTCLEARAVYIEIISFFTQLGYLSPRHAPRGNATSLDGVDIPPNESSNGHPISTTTSVQLLKYDPSLSALLNTSLAVATTKDLLRRSRIEELGDNLQRALKDDDINVACAMLETLSRAGPPLQTVASSPSSSSSGALARVYMDVCASTEAPEPRTLAVECLAVLLDSLLDRGGPKEEEEEEEKEVLQKLPDQKTLYGFWAELQRRSMNPSLSEAVIRLSGPLLAVCVSRLDRAPEDEESLSRWLRAWGAMMSDAGKDDRVSYFAFSLT